MQFMYEKRMNNVTTLGPFKLFDVALSVSGVTTVLARDNERAAWQALELSLVRGENLIDVRQCDEW